MKELLNRYNIVPLILLSLIILLIWLSRLFQSLWLDETLTYWLIKDGPLESINRSIRHAGQSPFYYVIESLLPAAGFRSEFALRVPSFIFSLLTLFFVYKIAARLFGKESGWYAAIIYSVTDGAIFSAVSARPYALAMMCSTGSLFYILKFIESRNKVCLLLSLGFMLATFYAHYMFLGCALIVILFIFSTRNRILITAWFKYAILSFPLYIPGLLHLNMLFARRSELSSPGYPGAIELLNALFPIVIATLFFVALFSSIGVLRGKIDKSLLDSPNEQKITLCVVLWHILPPLLLFIFAFLVGTSSLFTNRYYLWYSPALAILFSKILITIQPEIVRKLVIVIFTTLIIMAEEHRPIFTEDWRSLVESINTDDKESNNYLFYSGIIESSSERLLNDSNLSGYLTAPLSYYMARSKPILLPYRFDTNDGKIQWTKVIKPFLQDKNEVRVIGGDTILFAGLPISTIIEEMLKKEGFNRKSEKRFKKLWVSEFARN